MPVWLGNAFGASFVQRGRRVVAAEPPIEPPVPGTQGFVETGTYALTVDFTPVSGTSSDWTVYENRRFVRSGGTGDVVNVGSTKSYVHFKNCIFDAGYAGYKTTGRCFAAQGNTYLHDLIFENCYFKANINPTTGYTDSGMTTEILGRGIGPVSSPTFYNFGFYHCTWDPGRYEACSFDDGYNKDVYGTYGPSFFQNIVLEDCILGGGGNNSVWSYGECIEFNGNYGVRVSRCRIQASRTQLLNLQGPYQKPCDWVFTDCTVSAADRNPLQVIPFDYAYGYKLAAMGGVHEAQFNGCTFDTGTLVNYRAPGLAYFSQGSIAEIVEVNNYTSDNTWTNCTFNGASATRAVIQYVGDPSLYTGNVGLP